MDTEVMAMEDTVAVDMVTAVIEDTAMGRGLQMPRQGTATVATVMEDTEDMDMVATGATEAMVATAMERGRLMLKPLPWQDQMQAMAMEDMADMDMEDMATARDQQILDMAMVVMEATEATVATAMAAMEVMVVAEDMATMADANQTQKMMTRIL